MIKTTRKKKTTSKKDKPKLDTKQPSFIESLFGPSYSMDDLHRGH